MNRLPPALALAGPLVLLAAGLGAPGLARGEEDARPPSSILLVTIDTLRADRLAAAGPGEGARGETMPRLAELARRGVLFRHAISQTPLTVPSHVTILTGLDPRHHGVRDNNGYALAPGTPTLATILSARGFRCAAFIGGAPLARRADIARGFEAYDDRMTRASGGGPGPLSERRAGEVVGAALSWMGRLEPKARFFAWVHLYDPHDPYEAPAAARKPGDTPYDAEVRYADAALGLLVDGLKAAGRLPGTLIVVVGDHGEMLGEHGEATHGIFLYQGALAVPLVVALPGETRGSATDRATPLSDLLPTTLELLGIPAAGKLDGVSAAQELRAPAAKAAAAGSARTFYIETIHTRRRYGWAPLDGLVEWPKKFIGAPAPELYDLGTDPGESKNLVKGAGAGPWRARLDRMRGPGAPAKAEPLDEERLEALRSLGYLGPVTGTSGRDALLDRPRRDPKQGVAILPMLQAGLARLDAGDGRGAAKALEQALAIEPDSVLALHNRGIAALMLGDPADAAKWFGKAAASDPWSDNVQCDLGSALARLGKTREAEAAYRRALELSPDLVTARFNLAVLMLNAGRRDEARVELQKVRAANPDFPHLAEALKELEGSSGAPAPR